MDLATPNISIIIFWIVCFILAIANDHKKIFFDPVDGRYYMSLLAYRHDEK